MNDTIHQGSANTREALDSVIDAMASLQVVKTKLNNIYYHHKQWEDAQFLLDNIGRFAAPSDDAHEVLFERLQTSKEQANYAQRDDEKNLLLEQLAHAYLAVERAYKTVKR